MQASSVRFFLDENLPPQVARALALVGYLITHPQDEDKRGEKDAELISWLAREQYVWITKDHAARKVHGDQLLRESVSVVWVKGLEGKKNTVNTQQVHLMLTVELPKIIEKMQSATGPMYFALSLTSNGPRLVILRDEAVGTGKSSRALRRL